MNPNQMRIRDGIAAPAWKNVFLAATLLAAGTEAGAGWTDGKAAESVLGQSDFTSGQANQGGTSGPTTLNRPQGIARDTLTGKIFVADSTNNRVLRYSSTDAFATGSAAEAVFGADDFLTSEIGQASNRFFNPVGVSVDSGGRLWLADNINHRVLMFLDASNRESGANADGLLGATTFASNPAGNTSTQMSQPQDVALDAAGRLWVADWQNHRVLRFDDAVAKALANAADTVANIAPADGVLGQADFGQSTANRGGSIAANTMDLPWKLDVDPSGNLWVADAGNGRVLCFLAPGGKANGANADGLLGQPDFDTEQGPSASQSRFWGPRGIHVDSSGALWVTEEFNHRAVRFDKSVSGALANAATIGVNSTLPNGLLGQTDFTTNTQSTSDTGLRGPWDIVSSPYGDLWIVQYSLNANRVSRFSTDNSSYRSDGLIGLKATALKGNNRYNLSGSGQRIEAISKNRKRLNFYAKLQNDGIYSDDFTIKGTRGNRHFKVSYFSTTGGKTRVTGAVIGAGLHTDALPATGTRTYLIEVKPKASTKGSMKRQALRLTATSLRGGGADRVRATAVTAQ